LRTDVSIILPIHGNGEYLAETLNSISSQNFTGTFETILVLDRCTGAVFEIVERFKAILNPIVLISHNPGLVHALNLGIEFANGTFIARIDADDIMMNFRLTKQFEYLSENLSVVALGTSIIEIDHIGRIIGTRQYPTTAALTRRGLKKQCVIAHPSTMIQREALIKIGMYRKFFEFAEDYDLWLRLSKIGDVLNLEIPLTQYRVHENQSTSTHLKRGIYVSYSARISYFLSVLIRRDLPEIFRDFEEWQKSPFGFMVAKYVNFRLCLSWIKSSLKNNKNSLAVL
jgi:glycosyltransferase involved in cell wall biosynthesis